MSPKAKPTENKRKWKRGGGTDGGGDGVEERGIEEMVGTERKEDEGQRDDSEREWRSGGGVRDERRGG